jgi:coatomer protein complex subunit alpha (xenin)
VTKRSAEQEVKELVGICREYITAVRLELARQAEADPVRQCALASYFTRMKIKPIHLILGLKVAIKAAFSVQNFKLAGGFCRRILELCTAAGNEAAVAKVVNLQQIRGVLKHCEQNNSDAKQIDFKENVAFEICCASFTPIYKGAPVSYSPYTGSPYHARFEGEVCRTDEITLIGGEASGLSVFQDAKL